MQAESQTAGLVYEHSASESFKSKALKFAMWVVNMKGGKFIQKRLKSEQSEKAHAVVPSEQMKKDFIVTSWKTKDRDVYYIEPKANKTNKVIFFLHGGAYVFGLPKQHWNAVTKLVNDNNCSVLVLDYPLAPESSYLECFEYVDAVYNDLITKTNHTDIIFFGDSAGGGIALAFAMKLKEEGRPQPAQIILFSPWLDIAMNNPDIVDFEKEDTLLSVNGLRPAALSYARGLDLQNYLVSPINGPVEGLGKISLFISAHEIFYPDAKKFKALCEQKGVAIDFYVYPKMLHDWIIFDVYESVKSYEQLKTIIGSK